MWYLFIDSVYFSKIFATNSFQTEIHENINFIKGEIID